MAETVVMAAGLYLGAGGVVAAAFLVFGLTRIDAGARGALAFRPLILPGLVLLWPLVVAVWWRKARESAAR